MTMRSLTLGALATVATALSMQAQCGDPNFGPVLGTGDDIILPMQSLGFAFPFNGTTYTDVTITTNGLMYLSNAGVPAAGGSGCCAGVPANLVSGSPTIAPYWTDLNAVAGVGEVDFNNTIPGKAIVTWNNVYEYNSTVARTIQCQLWVTGEIFFSFDSRCALATHDLLIGMSEGAGATLPAASDFSVAGGSTTTTNYEFFNSSGLSYDLAGTTLLFAPSITGYSWVPLSCPGTAANNLGYGTGCYTASGSDSVYQLIATPAAAAAALSGTAVTFIPTGNSYLLTSGGTYVPPTAGAMILSLTDDSATTTPLLTTPFPYPGGVTTSFSVCSNGHVAVGSGNSTAYSPTAAVMLSNPQAAWYSWHDYNPAATGGGKVKFEQLGSITFITWDGVYNFSGTTAADANTFQMQFDSSNGLVTIVWQSMSANSSTLSGGWPNLAGYSPGGPSTDDGSLDFATALPYLVPNTALSPLSLAVDARAVSGPSSGSAMTFTVGHMIELNPGAGVYVGLHILSFGQVAVPGIDLSVIGMPGCQLYVQGLDATLSLVGLSPVQTSTIPIPAGLSPGLQFFSQAAALFAPGSLPNGQNTFGAVTSNAIASTIGPW